MRRAGSERAHFYEGVRETSRSTKGRRIRKEGRGRRTEADGEADGEAEVDAKA